MTDEEQRVYDGWLLRRRALLDAKQWGEAMQDVPRLTGLEPGIPRPLSRLLDVDRPTGELRVWHTHFDTGPAQQDINVVYPIDRLKELAAEGIVGRVASPAVSFMGYFANVFRIRDEVAPAVVAAVRGSGAEAAVLVPV